MEWVWVLSFTILGTNSQHGQVAKFATKSECEVALKQKIQEVRAKNQEVVATCFLRSGSVKPQ